jgi:hypothetical protein
MGLNAPATPAADFLEADAAQGGFFRRPNEMQLQVLDLNRAGRGGRICMECPASKGIGGMPQALGH